MCITAVTRLRLLFCFLQTKRRSASGCSINVVVWKSSNLQSNLSTNFVSQHRQIDRFRFTHFRLCTHKCRFQLVPASADHCVRLHCYIYLAYLLTYQLFMASCNVSMTTSTTMMMMMTITLLTRKCMAKPSV